MTDARELLAEATPLPWTGDMANDDGMWWVGKDAAVLAEVAGEANARLIVAAVNHLPDYLAAVDAAQDVMMLLDANGPSIVPHLLDTDDNPGERLRAALARLRDEVPA